MTDQTTSPKVTITSRFWHRYRTLTVDNALPNQCRALYD